MNAPCTCGSQRTGIVTSVREGEGEYGKQAQAPVCGLPECIAEATTWVERWSQKPAHHVLDTKTDASAAGDAS